MTPDARRLKGNVAAYAQLLRVPNLFTASADVLAGLLVTRGFQSSPLAASCVIASSVALYAAGVVLNDYCDRDVDAGQRPERPIPSGRIRAEAALRLAGVLFVLGVALAALASGMSWQPRSMMAAVGLVLCVVIYDVWLKRTPLGPVAMGACRSANWLLGLSLSPLGWTRDPLAVAMAIGLYIAGVTWFARREAERSSRVHLAGATLTMFTGMSLLWRIPYLEGGTMRAADSATASAQWTLLVGVLAAFIVRRVGIAIILPEPRPVQAAIKHAILSLVLLDAAATFAFAGPTASALVASLLIPTVLLGRWFAST